LSALGRPPSISVFLFAHLPPCSAIYLLSLHDALPIFLRVMASILSMVEFAKDAIAFGNPCFSELPADRVQVRMAEKIGIAIAAGDRKSTRLNSSHVSISYAVFCLKKKNYTETNCQS